MDPDVVTPWSIDWVWSLPLIVIGVAVHVVGLMLIFKAVVMAPRDAKTVWVAVIAYCLVSNI